MLWLSSLLGAFMGRISNDGLISSWADRSGQSMTDLIFITLSVHNQLIVAFENCSHETLSTVSTA